MLSLSHRQQILLEDIIAIADGMDVVNCTTKEFELERQNLDRTIAKLGFLSDRFNSANYCQSRSLAIELIKTSLK